MKSQESIPQPINSNSNTNYKGANSSTNSGIVNKNRSFGEDLSLDSHETSSVENPSHNMKHDNSSSSSSEENDKL
jgi:hypothetical protein